MDRFVIRGAAAVAAASSSASVQPRQRKLEQLKKVVTLDAGTTALVYTGEDLGRLQTVIQDEHATAEELILALRKLSCHEISLQDLQETVPLLHPSVQMLEYHQDADVARIAGRLVRHLLKSELFSALQVDKWMLLQDRRGKLPRR